MIPQNIKAIGGQAKRLRAVRDFITARVVQEDPLFITELLQEQEPDRTMCFMAIDGHVLNGGSPMVDPELQIERPPVRLMHLETGKPIHVKERKEERVPGTVLMVMNTRQRPIGDDVTVRHVVARDLLYKHGFPTLDHRTRGGKKGTIVEVAWLEAEARKPDCLPEILELYERLLPRIQKGTAAPKSADDKQQQLKGKVSQ